MKIIEKYFGDERTMYYSPPDKIYQDNFIKWHLTGENLIIISVGSYEGEVEVGCFRIDDKNSPKEIGNLIQALLYNGRIYE